MKIAVLSGKGGTGKTTVSTNLASVFKDAILIDADVEEPNASIFLKPVATETEKVYVEYPVVESGIHGQQIEIAIRIHVPERNLIVGARSGANGKA